MPFNTTNKSPFDKDCLHGKVALVTGGASGIGYEISRQLLLHGCRGVMICGRRQTFLQDAAKTLQQETGKSVLPQVCDVRNAQQCDEAVSRVRETFGRLDILVNGAAGNFLATAQDLKPKGFQTVLDIDAVGTFTMSHAAHNLLKASATKNTVLIVNISATLQYGATWWQSHASAAKAAVDSLTRSLALEWGPDNIRIVGIAPGPIANTPGTTKLAPGMENEVSELVAQSIPLRRMGRADEIGTAAVFLATADYVTGTTLVVDGGEWLYRSPMVPKELVAELSRTVEAKSRAQGPLRAKL